MENQKPYAIVSLGSKQQKVHPGDVITVEKLEGEDGDKISIDKVLFVNTGSDTRIGAPYLEVGGVEASIVGDVKGKKITVMYKRRRKHSKKKIGHRQHYTTIKIDSIK